MKFTKEAVVILVLLLSVGIVRADDPSDKKSDKHMVDMADGLNTQDFYDSKNPDGVWSSELKMPWAKSDAINAYEDNGKSPEQAASDEKPAGNVIAGESTGKVNGQPVDADQLVNIRVLYTLDAENSRASFSPVSAQNELFRQMSRHCSNGFQKIAEWSEPEGKDYYLYYQFKCMPKR